MSAAMSKGWAAVESAAEWISYERHNCGVCLQTRWRCYCDGGATLYRTCCDQWVHETSHCQCEHECPSCHSILPLGEKCSCREKYEECPWCRRTGKVETHNHSRAKCAHCDGTGAVERFTHEPLTL